MLTVRKIGSGNAAGYSQYLTGRADDEREAWHERGDYYTGDGAAGEWHGDTSTLDALGVTPGAHVEREQLARALRGERADSGEQLRRPGANGVVNSHDLTMGAPKSVSVLWAQSDGEQRAAIEQALKDAAEATVRYMALTTPCVQRRTESGERVWEPARGVASAHFVHHTARATSANVIPDPHLHVHCVVVAAERSDGRIVTPNQAAWMRHGREGGAYFRAELASRLREHGLEIEAGSGKGSRFFEVAGVPAELCDRLSGRSREVDAKRAQFVRQYGRLPRDQELADLAIKSRERKTAHTVAELDPYWRSVCAEHGFDRRAARGVWQHSRTPTRENAARIVAERLPALIAEHGATVRTREVRAMAYELSAGSLTPAEAMRVVDELQRSGRLIALADDRVTSHTVRESERYVLSRAADSSPAPAGRVGDRAIADAIKRTESAIGASLSDEQRVAVDVLASDARVAALTGPAGTGKGAVIGAASLAYQAEGRQVIAVATVGSTAMRLGGQAHARAYTIDGLAARVEYERIRLDERTVIFVDEAGMVDTHRLAILTRLAEDSGCQLRLIGDAAQLQAIGAGGLFEQVCQHVPTADLAQIHRAREEWMRQAQIALREGRSTDALTILREHDAAHMLGTQREAMMRMVDDWNQWRHNYDVADTLMVVHTSNADVDTVNMLAQAKRLEAGELGYRSVQAPDRAYQLHEGDRVMLRTEPYVFEDRSIPRVENGTRGLIVEADQRAGTVRVALDEPHREPRTVTIELNKCEALRLDYASHVYPAQGDTRSRTAELTGGPHTNREAAYVGGSRLRDRHDLYTSRQALGIDGTDHDRWQRLADQMNQSRAQVPSVAYREQPGRAIAADIPAVIDREGTEVRLAQVEREVARAVALRDELATSYPHQLAREIAQVRGDYKRARAEFEGAEQRIAYAQRDLERAKPWQREQLRDARERIERFTQQRDQAANNANRMVERHNELSARPDSPKAWKRDHAAELIAREQRADELTRQRDALRERSINERVRNPQGYLTRVIGERPAEPDRVQDWERGARAIESYRHEYQVTDRHTALGAEPDAQRDYQRWLAFDRTCGDVTRARDQLGRSNREHTFAPDRVADLARMRPGHGRGISRER